jgi:hypothetical protein
VNKKLERNFLVSLKIETSKKTQTHKHKKDMSSSSPTYIKHRVYFDGFEDYECEYQRNVDGRPAGNKVLTFRFLNNAWVLLWERDFCSDNNFPGMIERFEQATGVRADRIVYAFHCDTTTVLEAERLARGEAGIIHFAKIIDLAPVSAV